MLTIKKMNETMGVNSLLTAEDANPKTAKSGKLGISTAVLHLAPADLSGYEVCPMRSAGCTAACLHTAGNPLFMVNKEKARIARTKAFFEHRTIFMNRLVLELHKHDLKATADKYEPAARLNATSDIRWESTRFNLWPDLAKMIGWTGSCEKVSVLELFPHFQFYDYTKLHNRKKVPDNYHLTFSMNETNQAFAAKSKLNVAVVFAGKLPDTYLGRQVINGDEHDFRPQDPDNCVVGLKVKGKGKVDDSGFVVQL